MNNEERAELVFETLSKIVGFEIEPSKEFYITIKGKKVICLINGSLNLFYKKPDGYFELSDYSISQIFKGVYQLEEIKEPLLTEEAKEFLRQFKFEWLEIRSSIYSLNNKADIMSLYDKNNALVATIYLSSTNVSFDELKKDRKYTEKELGL